MSIVLSWKKWGGERSTPRRATRLRAADLGADEGEGAVGVGADGGDGRDAHHDDQRQHDRVLDRRRAVFLLQEIHHVLSQLLHVDRSFLAAGKSTRSGRWLG